MKVPYSLIMAMSVEKRHEQMKVALSHGFPRLKQSPIAEAAAFSIACYGPSLADTWPVMAEMQREGVPIISMSGATRFLSEHGVIADYHIDMDPRAQKVKHIDPPIKGVKYLMASVCPPQTWEILKNEDVTLFHIRNAKETEDWMRENDPGELMITAGSTIGLCAIQIGGVLGCRHFEIHGMDGSIRDGKRHAGPHYGHGQGGITWDAGHVTYQTSRIMANACSEVINCMRVYPIFCVFHGEGLQQALLNEEYDLPNVALAGVPYAAFVRKALYQFVGYSDEYKAAHSDEIAVAA
jgi:hypothetical protein